MKRWVGRGMPLEMAWRRFWLRVDKNGPLVLYARGRCWLWTGPKNEKGYGVANSRRMGSRLAHKAIKPPKHTARKGTCILPRTRMTLHRDRTARIETDSAASATAPRAAGTPSDAEPTLRIPYADPCDHIDLCGDSLVEVCGDDRWCVACGERWQDPHVVIVNDEVAHGS